MHTDRQTVKQWWVWWNTEPVSGIFRECQTFFPDLVHPYLHRHTTWIFFKDFWKVLQLYWRIHEHLMMLFGNYGLCCRPTWKLEPLKYQRVAFPLPSIFSLNIQAFITSILLVSSMPPSPPFLIFSLSPLLFYPLNPSISPSCPPHLSSRSVCPPPQLFPTLPLPSLFTSRPHLLLFSPAPVPLRRGSSGEEETPGAARRTSQMVSKLHLHYLSSPLPLFLWPVLHNDSLFLWHLTSVSGGPACS